MEPGVHQCQTGDPGCLHDAAGEIVAGPGAAEPGRRPAKASVLPGGGGLGGRPATDAELWALWDAIPADQPPASSDGADLWAWGVMFPGVGAIDEVAAIVVASDVDDESNGPRWAALYTSTQEMEGDLSSMWEVTGPLSADVDPSAP